MRSSIIKYYFQIYLKFISTSFTRAMSFRTHFILVMFLDLFFFISALATVGIIFEHIQNIGPWNRQQLFFFTAFMLAIENLHMTLISESFWRLSIDIRSGELDYILLRPTHHIFTIFFRYPRASTAFNTCIIGGILIYFGIQVELSTFSWILLPFFVLLGFSLLANIEFIIAALMFWTNEGLGINFLRMQTLEFSRWPDFVYSTLTRKVLIFSFPLLLIGSAPVHFLFDFHQWHLLAGMLVAIIISALIVQIVWRLALKRYDSASS